MAFILPLQKNHRYLGLKGSPRDPPVQTGLCLAHLADGCTFFSLHSSGMERFPLVVYSWIQLSFLSWNLCFWRNKFPKQRDTVSKVLFLLFWSICVEWWRKKFKYLICVPGRNYLLKDFQMTQYTLYHLKHYPVLLRWIWVQQTVFWLWHKDLSLQSLDLVLSCSRCLSSLTSTILYGIKASH